MQLYRQGDVLLQRADSSKIPEKFQLVPTDGGRVILAYGEVTGHAHALAPAYAKLYRWEGDHLLNVKEGATLTHEEHATVTLPAGVYHVVQQREYTPEAIRNVAD